MANLPISLSLEPQILQTIDEVAQKQNTTKQQLISSILQQWVDHQTNRLMVEGYLAGAQESQQIATEFQELSDEAWLRD